MTRISDFFAGFFPADSLLLLTLQMAAILLIALVAGATFGIWQGYNPGTYSVQTFVEMHQGAVRGLNTLLPATAFAAIILGVVLFLRSDAAGGARTIYLLAIVLMIAGGLVTRFGNQPINAQIMSWTGDTVPANWQALRDSWWTWHVVRTAISIAALACLIAAVLTGKTSG